MNSQVAGAGGGTGAPGTPAGRFWPTGVQENGVWMCRCIPRHPARKYQSKRQRSYGQYFWGCPQDRHVQCPFFQWDIENPSPTGPTSPPARTAATLIPSPLRTALPRPNNPQQSTMFQGVRTTPRTPTTPRNTRQTISNNEMDIDSDDDQRRLTTPRQLPAATRIAPTPTSAFDNSAPFKRKRNDTKNEKMDDLDLESSEERELMQLADRAEGNFQQQTRQGGQAQLPFSPAPVPVTPTRPTPQTPVTPTSARTRSVSSAFRNRLMIASENAPPHKKSRTDSVDTTPTRAGPSTVPRAFQGRDAIGAGTLASPSQNDIPNVTDGVMRTLEQSSVPAPVRAAVRNQLEPFSLRFKGVVAGRDMARDVIKTKNARIQELESRLAKLEAARLERAPTATEQGSERIAELQRELAAAQERARIAEETVRIAHPREARTTAQGESVRIAELHRALAAERERARIAEQQRDRIAERERALIAQQEKDARDDEDALESRLESLEKTSQESDGN